VRITIGGGYRTAAEMLLDVNAGLAVAYEHFTGKLNGFGGMAGTDGPGTRAREARDRQGCFQRRRTSAGVEAVG
jgi:hypothetical protein